MRCFSVNENHDQASEVILALTTWLLNKKPLSAQPTIA